MMFDVFELWTRAALSVLLPYCLLSLYDSLQVLLVGSLSIIPPSHGDHVDFLLLRTKILSWRLDSY